MSEIAYLRGILNKDDMNSVQEAMLSIVVLRQREREAERELAMFEQNMFVTNPAMYKEYKENQEEQETSGNKDVTWLAPSSIEEMEELNKLFGEIDEQLSNENNGSLPQANLLDVFGGINLDEIGGDD